MNETYSKWLNHLSLEHPPTFMTKNERLMAESKNDAKHLAKLVTSGNFQLSFTSSHYFYYMWLLYTANSNQVDQYAAGDAEKICSLYVDI